MSVTSVWGIPVEGWSLTAIAAEVKRRRSQKDAFPFWLVTANPEILLHAHSYPEYKQSLCQADLRTVDGFGLQLMLRLTGTKTTRVTGVELADKLLNLAYQYKWRVAIIGGRAEVADQAKANISQRFSGMEVFAEAGGSVLTNGEDDLAGEETRHRLTLFSPDVLFVCFGHPKQEQWIARYLADFPSVKVVVGLGGTVDFWAKTIQRAPRWMQRMGLEWLWRLFQQPKRIGRILRAVVIFPARFLWDRLRSKLNPSTK